jgi:hypothetical protein
MKVCSQKNRQFLFEMFSGEYEIIAYSYATLYCLMTNHSSIFTVCSHAPNSILWRISFEHFIVVLLCELVAASQGYVTSSLSPRPGKFSIYFSVYNTPTPKAWLRAPKRENFSCTASSRQSLEWVHRKYRGIPRICIVRDSKCAWVTKWTSGPMKEHDHKTLNLIPVWTLNWNAF